jgi:thioredoxin reductase
MAKEEGPRIAILGAGPIGLEAALQAHRLGYRITIYERGDVAEHVLRWGHVRLFSPFGWNSTPLGIEAIRKENPKHNFPATSDLLTGRDYRDAYLLPLSLTPGLVDSLQLKTEVLRIGRTGLLKTDSPNDPKRSHATFRLLFRDEKGAERVDEADLIFDCTGTYRKHRWLGDGGIPALGEITVEKQIAYSLEDVRGDKKAHYANKSIILIGSGYSAATTVCNLATLSEDHPATWTIWLSHNGRTTPLPRIANDPLKERDRLAAKANSLANRGDGNVEYHSLTLIDKIESHGNDKGFSVHARCAGEPMSWIVDRVIANIGYIPDTNLFEELHVQLFDNGSPSIRQPEPGYFVLGAKSMGRDSNFLLKTGFEQIQAVFSLLGKVRLAG